MTTAQLSADCIFTLNNMQAEIDALRAQRDAARAALLRLATLPVQSPEMFDNPSVRVTIYNAIDDARILAADIAREG